MKTTLNRLGKKILSKMLVLLGFSCSFVFMACYGPRPNYAPAELVDNDTIPEEEVVVDSTASAEAVVSE